MKTPTTLLACLCTAFQFARAESVPAEAAEASAPPAESTIVLKHRSSFVLDESGRSPFWPIGWKPATANGTDTKSYTTEISPSAFTVTSITVEPGGRYAIINGKVMNEGQVFGLQIANQIHQITVKAIQDGQVVLSRHDQEFAVTLRRR